MSIWDHRAVSISLGKSTPVEKVVRNLYSRRIPGRLTIGYFNKLLGGYRDGDEFCRRSLVLLSGHDFGDDYSAWENWFREYSEKPRTAWMLDGLARYEIKPRNDSWKNSLEDLLGLLDNGDTLVRHNSYKLLVEYTGNNLPFSPHASEEIRKDQVELWWKWYNKKGHDSALKLESRKKNPPYATESVELVSDSLRVETETLINGFKSPVKPSRVLKRSERELSLLTVVLSILLTLAALTAFSMIVVYSYK